MNLRTEEAILNGWSGDPARPLVSICCMSYNHEPYIEAAIRGFLIQETDFPIEVMVHDDASTDGTQALIRRYAERYPRIIRAVLQTENQFSQGNKPGELLRTHARGKYIALCEGDDCWTDPLKLRKQVELLETHPRCKACCTAAIRRVGLDASTDQPLEMPFAGVGYLETPAVIERNDIVTCTVVYLRELAIKFPAPPGILQVDYNFWVHASLEGPIGYLPDRTAVRRVTGDGLWSSLNGIAMHRQLINVWTYFLGDLPARYHPQIRRLLSGAQFSLACLLAIEGAHKREAWHLALRALPNVLRHRSRPMAFILRTLAHLLLPTHRIRGMIPPLFNSRKDEPVDTQRPAQP